MFLLEAGKHAAFDGDAAVHDQQVGIALRCKFVVENYPATVSHRGIDVLANSNGVRRLGAGGKNPRALQMVESAVETDFDPQPTRLLQQGSIQRLRTRSPFHQVKQRLAA